MRIIAGRLGGRQFGSPRGHRTHPMSEKGRGALFNALGDIEGLSVLDAYAGSGALAFEALSRGARSAMAIDTDGNAHRTITENCQKLGLEKDCKAIRASVQAWSARNPEARFDVILADPPYDKPSARAIQDLSNHIAAGGTLVLSWPPTAAAPELPGMLKLQVKDYGDATLIFYKKGL